jgi:hypothetical protein
MRSGRARRAFLGGVALAVAGIASAQGCSLVTSYDGFVEAGAPTCGRRIPPPPASPGSAADKAGGPFIGAMRYAKYDNSDNSLGYDLDEHCDKGACAATKKPFGNDDTIGAFIPNITSRNPAFGDDLLSHGEDGLIVKLDGWNGEATDAKVTVTLYNVAGVNGAVGGTGDASFVPDDTFIPRTEDLGGTGVVATPPNLAPRAYVTGNVLVAPFATLNVRLIAEKPRAAINVLLHEAFLVGKINAAANGGLSLDAQIVGRVLGNEMLDDIGRLGTCPGTTEYRQGQAALCGLLDLTASKTTDGLNQKCVAGSFAIGATIVPARLATTSADAHLDDLCEAGSAATCP